MITPEENNLFKLSCDRDKVKMLWRKIKQLAIYGCNKFDIKNVLPEIIPRMNNYTIDKKDIITACQWVKESDRIFFYTGAGMSAGSGIPTYRGKFGLWVLGRDILFILFNLFVISIMCTFIFAKSWFWFFMIVFLFVILFVVGTLAPFAGALALSTPWGWNHFPILSWIIFKLFFFDKVAKAKLNDGHLFMYYLQDILKKEVYVITSNVDNLECQVSSTCKRKHGRIDMFYCSTCGSDSPQFQFDPKKGKLPWLPPKCPRCNERLSGFEEYKRNEIMKAKKLMEEQVSSRIKFELPVTTESIKKSDEVITEEEFRKNILAEEQSAFKERKKKLLKEHKRIKHGRYIRTGCLLFSDWGYGEKPSFIRTENPPFYHGAEKKMYFVIGSSDVVPITGGIENNEKVIEINLTEKPTTDVKEKTEDYIYFQAPQEHVLRDICSNYKD